MKAETGDETVGVLGLGLLGRGIAACFLGHGFKVVGWARTRAELAQAEEAIGEAVREMIARGCIAASRAGDWRERFAPATAMGALADCDFVIESVIEDAAAKAAVFDAVEAVVGAEVPIASNTSAIPISGMQSGLRFPGRFLGMHWAAPAHATRFMELIRGAQTGDAAMARAESLARRIGKEPCVVARDVPGFVANRLAYAMYREALHLMETGVADRDTIDLAWRNGAGLWSALCGPLRWIDITGGPELYARAMEGVLGDLSRAAEVPAPLRELAESGAQGTRNGRGFYAYTEEEAARWEKLYREHAWAVRELQENSFPPG
jgi:3-hydroxybutyryl-CoA dehydrogenase